MSEPASAPPSGPSRPVRDSDNDSLDPELLAITGADDSQSGPPSSPARLIVDQEGPESSALKASPRPTPDSIAPGPRPLVAPPPQPQTTQTTPALPPAGPSSSSAGEKPAHAPMAPPVDQESGGPRPRRGAPVTDPAPAKPDSSAPLKTAEESPRPKPPLPSGPPPPENLALHSLLGASEPSSDAPALLREAFEGKLTNMSLAVGPEPEKDPLDNTALHWAAAGARTDTCRALLKAGARLEANGLGCSPLHVAAHVGVKELVEALVASEACGAEAKSAKDKAGNTHMHCAVMSDAVDSITILRKSGSPLESFNAQAETPLTAAFNLARIRSIKVLQELGASKHSALHWAAEHGFDAVVKDLLETAKSPVDLLDDARQTPLLRAARNGHATVVSQLLKAKANYTRAHRGTDETPLIVAAKGGHLQVVNAILAVHPTTRKGQESVENVYDEYLETKDAILGMSALHHAAAAGHDLVLQALIEARCFIYEPSAGDRDGTALHLATRHGQLNCVKILADLYVKSEHKIGIDLMTSDAMTPYTIATRDKTGKTALQYASNEAVVLFLENALQKIVKYKEIFEVNLQVELKKGSEGLVMMAKHTASGNAVAIKFHRHLENRDHSFDILSRLSNGKEYVAGIANLKGDLAKFEDLDRYPEYPYALAVDGGDSDLDSVLAEMGGKPLPENQIRWIFESMASCVLYLHLNSMVHHDLKPANFVRFYDGRYRLVDFDQSRQVGADMGMTTIEICPPECAKAMLCDETLPAHRSMDIWSLGVCLYRMNTQSLLLHDLYKEQKHALESLPGDLYRIEALRLWSTLTQDRVDALLDKFGEARSGVALAQHAMSLLKKLLLVDPHLRCPIDQVANHPFIKGGTTETMTQYQLMGIRREIENVSDKVESVLTHVVAIHERIIKLSELPDQLAEGLRTVHASLKGIKHMMIDVATKDCPSHFVITPDLPTKDGLSAKVVRSAAMSWLDTLDGIFGGRMEAAGVLTKLGGKRLRLKLCCERCQRPRGEGYLIETPGEWTVKMLPALQVAFRVAQVANIAATVGRFFFPALPAIPADVLDKARGLLDTLGTKSSVEDFACIRTELDGAIVTTGAGESTAPKLQVGAGLRELRAFLSKADPTNSWAGLSLVHLEASTATESSSVLWVCEECLSGGAIAADTESDFVPREEFSLMSARCESYEKKIERMAKLLRRQGVNIEALLGDSGIGFLPASPRTEQLAAGPAAGAYSGTPVHRRRRDSGSSDGSDAPRSRNGTGKMSIGCFGMPSKAAGGGRSGGSGSVSKAARKLSKSKVAPDPVSAK